MQRWGGQECGEISSHVAFLSAAEIESFFETFLLLFLGKFLWFFSVINIHSVGVSSRGVSGGGGGVGGSGSAGGMLFSHGCSKLLLTKELVNFVIPAFGGGWDNLHAIDLIWEPDWDPSTEIVDDSCSMGGGIEFSFNDF